MLTAPQLVTKLLRSLNTGGVFANLETEDKEHILDAINAGVQEFYRLAPEELKRAPIDVLVPAPVSTTIGLTAGSTAFTGLVPTSAQVRQTIVIGGVRHQLASTTALRYPWEGTTGTHNAIIYGDSLVMSGEAVIERLVSAPLLDDQRTLTLWEGLPEDEVEVGIPSYYRLDHYGQVVSSRPSWVLRMWPLPDAAYRLSVRAQLTGYALTLANLVDSSVYVPVENRFVEGLLLPIVNFHLSDHRLWRAPENISIVMQKYAVAKTNLQTLPRVGMVPANRVHTPRNF